MMTALVNKAKKKEMIAKIVTLGVQSARKIFNSEFFDIPSTF